MPAYEHANGEVLSANAETARAMCPFLGKLSVEESNLLLELASLGQEHVDSKANIEEVAIRDEPEATRLEPAALSTKTKTKSSKTEESLDTYTELDYEDGIPVPEPRASLTVPFRAQPAAKVMEAEKPTSTFSGNLAHAAAVPLHPETRQTGEPALAPRPSLVAEVTEPSDAPDIIFQAGPLNSEEIHVDITEVQTAPAPPENFSSEGIVPATHPTPNVLIDNVFKEIIISEPVHSNEVVGAESPTVSEDVLASPITFDELALGELNEEIVPSDMESYVPLEATTSPELAEDIWYDAEPLDNPVADEVAPTLKAELSYIEREAKPALEFIRLTRLPSRHPGIVGAEDNIQSEIATETEMMMPNLPAVCIETAEKMLDLAPEPLKTAVNLFKKIVRITEPAEGSNEQTAELSLDDKEELKNLCFELFEYLGVEYTPERMEEFVAGIMEARGAKLEPQISESGEFVDKSMREALPGSDQSNGMLADIIAFPIRFLGNLSLRYAS